MERGAPQLRPYTGVYILQNNTMARGGRKGAGEKMKNEAVRDKMNKKEKGERIKEKRKRGRVIFFLQISSGTLLLIIVYKRDIS